MSLPTAMASDRKLNTTLPGPRRRGNGGRWLARWRDIQSRSWWPWAKRAVTLGFFALIAALVFTEARAVSWPKVYELVRETPPRVLIAAAAFALLGHVIYAMFDLIGRRYTGHRLSTPMVVMVTFVSYVFNLNLGATIGGVATRYRLYARLGLPLGTITRVVSVSMFTNFLGYLLLAGIVLCWQPLKLPSDWQLRSDALRGVGMLLIGLATGYVIWCARSRRRQWKIRGQPITLPSLPMALVQLLLSCANWLAMASIIYMLLQQKVSLAAVLCGLLGAAVAGVITHVPAGLGVLEAVFVMLLATPIGKEQLLAALLMYRMLYYLLPMAVATLLFFTLEARIKKSPTGEAASS